MHAPVTGVVLFDVNVSFAQHRDGHWRAIASETGIVTYGKTEAEAESANRAANLILVRSWKKRGEVALDRFMREHGIVYRVVNDERPQERGAPNNDGPAAEWTGPGILLIAA